MDRFPSLWQRSQRGFRVAALMPLATNNDAVTAYLRRTGDDACWWWPTWGGAPVSPVTISSEAGVLTQGRYRVRSLLGGADAPLTVGADGRIEAYSPATPPQGAAGLRLRVE